MKGSEKAKPILFWIVQFHERFANLSYEHVILHPGGPSSLPYCIPVN